ncbi:FKBP-type peptidyl-prolyl cis-trans isomerase FklB [hydrothermal vent metagenome]|uniref:peptidylprolyl isomerase n=1 Tax=hydrothermal vent metagenome TaxID=652676 RepID=A0A3B0ZF84_9ZZZZ
MKKVLRFALTSALVIATTGQALAADVKSTKQKTSYAIGVNMSNNLKSLSSELDVEALIDGLSTGLKGSKLKLTDEEMKTTLMAFQKKITEKRSAEKNKAKSVNVEAGKKFLADNKKKKGIITTKSGLQYKVIKSAQSGKSPKATETVTTHYRGTLIDGTEFDSSYARKKPTSFPVNGVIKGWTEALQLMKPGDKWKLFIPADLAYGDRGAGPKIGPGATLIFDIELIKIGS